MTSDLRETEGCAPLVAFFGLLALVVLIALVVDSHLSALDRRIHALEHPQARTDND